MVEPRAPGPRVRVINTPGVAGRLGRLIADAPGTKGVIIHLFPTRDDLEPKPNAYTPNSYEVLPDA